MFGNREYTVAGGLMSYGDSLKEFYRRAAYFVDKIFKGTKPADLPIEQPTQFNLVIAKPSRTNRPRHVLTVRGIVQACGGLRLPTRRSWHEKRRAAPSSVPVFEPQAPRDPPASAGLPLLRESSEC